MAYRGVVCPASYKNEASGEVADVAQLTDKVRYSSRDDATRQLREMSYTDFRRLYSLI